MKFLNKTPFSADVFEDYASDAERYTIVAIRASYELTKTSEKSAKFIIAKEQDPFLWEDEYEETPHGLMLVKQSDFIPYKPATDVILEGAAHLYGGENGGKANQFAELDVRGTKKKLLFYGPRFYSRSGAGGDSWNLSTENFKGDSVPLRWDLAYGGKVQNADSEESDAFNPIGIGNMDLDISGGDKNKAYPAPQFEYAEEPHLAGPDRATPAGFGAVAPSWRWRRQYSGTYDQNWRENIHPFRPLDFNYKFWNCAPPDPRNCDR